MINQKKSIAVGEMVLLISFSFAVAFIFGESVSAFGSSSLASLSSTGIPSENIRASFDAADAAALRGDAVCPSGGCYRPPVTGPAAAGLPNADVAGFTQLYGTSNGAENIVVGGQSITVETYKNGNVLTGLGSDGAIYHNTGSGWATGPSGAAGSLGSAAAGTAPGTGKLAGLMNGQYFGYGFGSSILSGALWGALAGGIAYGVAKLMGLNDKSSQGIGLGVGAGTFVGASLYLYGQGLVAPTALGGGSLATAQLPFIFSPLGGILIGGGIAAVIIYATYTKEKKELVKFECLPWEPPTGGLHCEECNNEDLPCSEYKCKSLGQACDIINPGTLEERCIWVGKGDATAPKIEPWEQALTNGLKYIPDRAISPPNRGFKIVDEVGDDCLPAFLNFEFGVIADEPAQCRVDFFASNNYENMSEYFGGDNLFVEEHSQRLKAPTPFSEDEIDNNLVVGSDGTYKLWVRCIDANGNGKDSAQVVFSFCVDEAEDVTQPIVEGTSILDGSPIRFGANEIQGFELFTNEPAECRWSRQDKAFDVMENPMNCATESYQINSQLNYVCSSTLTGIVDAQANDFYFRCKDYSTAPGGRNEMTSSYKLSLRGTEKLTVKAAGPTEDQTGSSDVISVNLTVETAHGAEEGKSICYYSTSPGEFSIPMEGDTHMHNQLIDLTEGEYSFYFRCIDLGANVAEGNTTFNVLVDKNAPKLTRVFRDGNKLKVITDEEARCFYSLNNCNYNSEEAAGTLTYDDPRKRDVHVTDWDESNTYYIKCEDLRGRQPDPDECQLIVKASEL